MFSINELDKCRSDLILVGWIVVNIVLKGLYFNGLFK